MPSWYSDRDDQWFEFEVPSPELWESENPVIGTLLGPDGEVLAEVHEREHRPFGYRPSR